VPRARNNYRTHHLSSTVPKPVKRSPPCGCGPGRRTGEDRQGAPAKRSFEDHEKTGTGSAGRWSAGCLSGRSLDVPVRQNIGQGRESPAKTRRTSGVVASPEVRSLEFVCNAARALEIGVASEAARKRSEDTPSKSRLDLEEPNADGAQLRSNVTNWLGARRSRSMQAVPPG
jgi:hypothetical protein